MDQQELLFTAGGNAKCTITLEDSWQFLTKLNTSLPYDPTVTLLAIYPKENKIYVHQTPAHGCLQQLH